jgi:hypothetical protein
LIIKFLELGDPEKEAYLADLATQGKDTHVARYRKYWAAQQAGKLTRHDRDFADQKSRKGEVFIGVSHEIAAALQDRFAELGLTFKSGNRGEQFLREKEGSGKWSVADALDYQDLLDLIESSRRHFFYDEVSLGRRKRSCRSPRNRRGNGNLRRFRRWRFSSRRW